jgi:AraC-like DNA-binding protein
MHVPPDIFTIANRQQVMHDELVELHHRQQQIPGSVQFEIRRYQRNPRWNIDDTGMLVYHYEKQSPADHYLELKFCFTGNMYCGKKEGDCSQCARGSSRNCTERVESMDIVSFRFTAAQLSQFIKPRKGNDVLTDRILHFHHVSSFSKILPLCGKTRMVLDAILNHPYSGSFENIFINAQTQMLLLYSLDCMLGEKEVDVVNCKFLANEADREKILKAREILVQQIGEPITIRELSRKVAINECYLKKGFKEMFGTTIFDFYQGQRMEHAKYLLYEKGLSVTEVSMMLGYSSISHFSTAFKKHTGLKPCELLFRS